MKKHTARPIEENINGVVVLEGSNRVLKWVALKHRRIRGLICRESQIEVRVLLERDTCTIFVTAKVPKDFREGRTGTEHLWSMNKIIIEANAEEIGLTAHDDGVRIGRGQ